MTRDRDGLDAGLWVEKQDGKVEPASALGHPEMRDMRFDMFRYASVLVVCVACNKPKPAVNHERNVPPTELARATQPPPAAQPQPAAVAQTPSPEEPVPVRLQREMDAAAKLTPTTAAEMTSIRPILKCVEKVSDKQWTAHFGYKKAGKRKLTIPLGFHNRAWPPPIGQGQPLVFSAPSESDVMKIEFAAGATVAWILGQSFQVATTSSPACPSKGAKHASSEQADAHQMTQGRRAREAAER